MRELPDATARGAKAYGSKRAESSLDLQAAVIDSSGARIRELFLAGDDDHAARFDRIRLALESAEYRIYNKAHARKQAGHLGERVQPDDIAHRFVAGLSWV